jgi:hypothetical protein
LIATALPECEFQKIQVLASRMASNAAARCEYKESISGRYGRIPRKRIRTAVRRRRLRLGAAVPKLTAA